jgi:hypothetical protein
MGLSGIKDVEEGLLATHVEEVKQWKLTHAPVPTLDESATITFNLLAPALAYINWVTSRSEISLENAMKRLARLGPSHPAKVAFQRYEIIARSGDQALQMFHALPPIFPSIDGIYTASPRWFVRDAFEKTILGDYPSLDEAVQAVEWYINKRFVAAKGGEGVQVSIRGQVVGQLSLTEEEADRFVELINGDKP